MGQVDTLEYIRDKYNLDLGQRSMPINIPNVNREDLAELFAELGFKYGAEIGTERGLYAETLCKANPELKLFCVDAWASYGEYIDHISQSKLDGFYAEAQERMSRYNCKLIRDYSVNAAKKFKNGSLGFVYIDANHSLNYVIQDIYAWLPKVRVGGIISGHDFIRRKEAKYKCAVVEAVMAYTMAYHVRPWFVFGRKHPQPNERRDRARSWLWVKT